jgi:hypothetical protein
LELAIGTDNYYESHLAAIYVGLAHHSISEDQGSAAKKVACAATNACLALDGLFQNEVSLDLQKRWISGEITTEQRISMIEARYKGEL